MRHEIQDKSKHRKIEVHIHSLSDSIGDAVGRVMDMNQRDLFLDLFRTL